MNCSTPTHLCLFCLRKFENSYGYDVGNTEFVLSTFLKVIQRTFKNGGGNDFGKIKEFLCPFAPEEHESALFVCKDCVRQFKIVCDLHSELKMLEMKLDWRMYTICKIMNCAELIPSRRENYLECLQKKKNNLGDGDRLVLSSFRKKFIRNCNRQRNGRFPRVRLRNCAASWKRVNSNASGSKKSSRKSEHPPGSSVFGGERDQLFLKSVLDDVEIACSPAASATQSEALSSNDHDDKEMASDIEMSEIPLVTEEAKGDVNLSNLKGEGQVQKEAGTGPRVIRFCRVCKTSVDSSTHKHVRKPPKKKFQCEHCPQTFADNWTVRRHAVGNHLHTFFSDMKREENTQEEFRTHVNRFVEKFILPCRNPQDKETFLCPICNEDGRKRKLFRVHLFNNDMHVEEMRSKFDQYMKNLPSLAPKKLLSSKFKCESCGVDMTDKWKLQRHIVSNHLPSFFSYLRPLHYTQETFDGFVGTFLREYVDSCRAPESTCTYSCEFCRESIKERKSFRTHLFKNDEHIGAMQFKFGQYVQLWEGEPTAGLEIVME